MFFEQGIKEIKQNYFLMCTIVQDMLLKLYTIYALAPTYETYIYANTNPLCEKTPQDGVEL